MKSQKAVSLLLSVAVVSAFFTLAPSAGAAQGALMLRGSLVNAACDAQALNAPLPVSDLKILNAGAQISVGLSRADDACHQLAVPVHAHYAALSSNGSAHTGIVTLTYQ
jgi:hypothetical protein